MGRKKNKWKGKRKDGSQVVHKQAGAYWTRSCQHIEQPVRVGEHNVYCTAELDLWCAKPANRVKPDLGIYLAHAWLEEITWDVAVGDVKPLSVPLYPAHVVAWPDYGVVPVSVIQALVSCIVEALEEGKRVEVGCTAAHGRTGALMSCLLIEVEGMTPREAIEAVRKRLCQSAIETPSQLKLVYEFAGVEYTPEMERVQAAAVPYKADTSGTQYCEACDTWYYSICRCPIPKPSSEEVEEGYHLETPSHDEVWDKVREGLKPYPLGPLCPKCMKETLVGYEDDPQWTADTKSHTIMSWEVQKARHEMWFIMCEECDWWLDQKEGRG